MTKWNIEFSLALHNRTGKYFIGRDIIQDQADLIGRVYYWRVPGSAPLNGVAGKLAGRAIQWEQKLAIGNKIPKSMRFRPGQPLLHLDPFTVLHTRLEHGDAVLCHDMGPITHPELFTPSVMKLYQAAYAMIARDRPRMVFVSQATADAFCRLYGQPSDGRVIYPPLRAGLTETPRSSAPKTARPYLLTVGSIGHRKNQRRSIEAYARSGLAQRGIDYVLCGSREPGSDDVSQLAEATPGVRLLKYVTDEELKALYRGASGFVLVSLLEGFGVPVAEAIAQGLIPLVSHESVLKEVAGDGALEVDPLDIDAIAVAMVRLIDMDVNEQERRRAMLGASIRRFTHSHFAAEWRAMLTDINIKL